MRNAMSATKSRSDEVHSSHELEKLQGRDRCRRCGSMLVLRLSQPCPGGGWDLTHPRPWKAEPMDLANPHRAWMVTCASRSGDGRDTVCTHMSERDAVEIASVANR